MAAPGASVSPTVVAATRPEAWAARRTLPRGCPVVRAGVGCSRGLPPLAGPAIVCGLAGALVESLAPGTVLVPERVADEAGWEGTFDPTLREALLAGARRLGLEAVGGTLLTSDRVVRGGRRLHWRERGFWAADMESARVLRAVPRTATVRVVLDAPEQDLVLAPRGWPGLLRAAWRAPGCAALAARVVRAALPLLAERSV